MKNRKRILLLAAGLLICAGCTAKEVYEEQNSITDTQHEILEMKDKRIMIAYFTRAENIDYEEEEDTTTAASLVMKDGVITGNTGYVASLIQQETNGVLLPVKMSENYPSDYDELVEIAKREGSDHARPAVDTQLKPDDFDILFLGYPNWWHDMPMGMYTMLEQTDLTGKIIIPFVTHGGSVFSDTVQKLRDMYPDATVLDGLAVFQHDVTAAQEEIHAYIESIMEK